VPPLISIKSFHVDASLLRLWRKHVDHVQLDGLDISIPPKPVRVQQKEAGRAADANQPAGPAPEPTPEEKRQDPLKTRGVVLDRIDTNDARLIIVPGKPDKAPKVWAIHHLRMHKLGSIESWPFKATLTNGVPPGEIQVDGRFGPWDRNVPGDTPLGLRIASKRRRLGFSQKALARCLGIDEGTVRRSEREGICKLGLRVQRILERWVDGCG